MVIDRPLALNFSIAEVAPNTKKNYKYKTLILCILENPVTKCANTKAQVGN